MSTQRLGRIVRTTAQMWIFQSLLTLLSPEEPQSVLWVAVEPWEIQSQLTSVKLLVLGICAHIFFLRERYTLDETHTHIRSNERQCFIH